MIAKHSTPLSARLDLAAAAAAPAAVYVCLHVVLSGQPERTHLKNGKLDRERAEN